MAMSGKHKGDPHPCPQSPDIEKCLSHGSLASKQPKPLGMYSLPGDLPTPGQSFNTGSGNPFELFIESSTEYNGNEVTEDCAQMIELNNHQKKS